MSDAVGVSRAASSTRFRRRIGAMLATGALASSVIVAGVSGGAANASSGPLLSLSVGTSAAAVDAMPFYAALNNGYFTKAGLNVSVNSISGGDAAIDAALDSNSIQVGLGSVSMWIGDLLRGSVTGKVIGEFTDNNYEILATSGITSMSQLAGKVIGVSSINAGDYVFIATEMEAAGVSPSSVKWVAVGSPAARLAALSAGQVSAIEEPVTNVAGRYAGITTLLSAAKAPVKFVSNGIFVNQSYLNANKKKMVAFLGAIAKGAAWTRKHQTAAASVCLQTGAGSLICQHAIKVASASRDPWMWSTTTAVDLAAVKAMIPGVAATIAGSSPATPVSALVDSSLAGTKP